MLFLLNWLFGRSGGDEEAEAQAQHAVGRDDNTTPYWGGRSDEHYLVVPPAWNDDRLLPQVQQGHDGDFLSDAICRYCGCCPCACDYFDYS